jgi:hypothetical protein
MLPSLSVDTVLTLGGIVVAIAIGWATLQAQSKRSGERLDEQQRQLTGALSTFREESTAGRQLAQEALRQAQSAHSRVDALTLSQQAMEVGLARLDERQKLKNTARFRLDNPEDNS